MLLQTGSKGNPTYVKLQLTCQGKAWQQQESLCTAAAGWQPPTCQVFTQLHQARVLVGQGQAVLGRQHLQSGAACSECACPLKLASASSGTSSAARHGGCWEQASPLHHATAASPLWSAPPASGGRWVPAPQPLALHLHPAAGHCTPVSTSIEHGAVCHLCGRGLPTPQDANLLMRLTACIQASNPHQAS